MMVRSPTFWTALRGTQVVEAPAPVTTTSAYIPSRSSPRGLGTSTRTFAVRVSILDPDTSVQWGMTANVGVMTTTTARAAVVPLTSIYQKDGKPAVWRYDPATGQVSLAPVEVSQYREDGVLVASGVANGDWIVTAGVHKLIEGQVVRPYDAGPSSALNAQPSPARARS